VWPKMGFVCTPQQQILVHSATGPAGLTEHTAVTTAGTVVGQYQDKHNQSTSHQLTLFSVSSVPATSTNACEKVVC